MTRTREQYLDSLNDGRAVFLDGQRIEDVRQHRAFRNAVQTVAGLYALQGEHEDEMTFVDPVSGHRLARHWQLPTCREDLATRRAAMTRWSQASCGFFGRSPDHIPSALVGMVMARERLRAIDQARTDALMAYVEYASQADLYLTYTIINPQGNQSRAAGEQGAAAPGCRVVDEDAQGITVHGAKMLGTGAVMANEVFVAQISPLKKGDEDFAVSFAVPLNTPGLKILSRKSYEAHAVSEFDNPLSSRFDENDALVVFDQVKVPWERVFACRDLAMIGAQFRETPAPAMQNHHSQIRLGVKLSFLLGLAKRIAEINGVLDFPQVRQQLGRMSASVAMVECFVHGMEATAECQGAYCVPNRRLMHAATCITQELYPDFISLVRELAGGGLIMLPSSAADFEDPALRMAVARTQTSGVTDAYGRVKAMKLAWDAVGSEFASRHVQYEMFYAGAQVFQREAAYRYSDWVRMGGLVDDFMGSYDLAPELRPAS